MVRDRGEDGVGLEHHPGLPPPLLPVDETQHPVHADARHLGIGGPGLSYGAV